MITITRIIRADWSAAFKAAARAVVPAIALAYVAGMAFGRWLHDLNDALAQVASGRAAAPAVAHAGHAAVALPAPAPTPFLAIARPLSAAAAIQLADMSNRELMELVGTRRRLPKRQLIALALEVA